MGGSWKLIGRQFATAVIIAASVGAGPAAAKTQFGTVRHPATGLQINVPAGYKMAFHKGIYILRAPGRTLSFSRAVTSVGADAYGDALLAQIVGKVVFRQGGPAEFAAQIDFGGRREAFVILRQGTRLLVTDSSSKVSNPLALQAIRSIGLSARGGVALQAPAQGSGPTTQPIALRAFQGPNGASTAQVPAGSAWTVEGNTQGAIQGSSPNGSFVYGHSIDVAVPEAVPGPVPPGFAIAPYMNAADALTQFLPQITTGVTNVQILGVIHDAVFPTYTSSAMFRYSFQQNGQAWTGAAIVGTDAPANYGNLSWKFYYSAIAVRVGADPSVGVGLLKSWKTYDPSGAINARTNEQRRLIDETNQVWQQTSEFRSQTADRQSRDVGCLIQGYYAVEDNSRKYNLPPLPCGQIYTKKT